MKKFVSYLLIIGFALSFSSVAKIDTGDLGSFNVSNDFLEA